MSAEISSIPSQRTAAVNAQASTYRIEGGKVGVLLLHGLCGTPAEMRFIAMGLSKAGYTVHCPLVAGHGASRRGIAETSWEEWYRSAEDALDELAKTCTTVIVGGLCVGAILAIHLAARRPDKVKAVALFSPTLWVNGWAIKRHLRLLALVPFKFVAKRIHFDDVESLGIKCPRVREFVRTALAASGDLGTSGTPGTMVLEHRWLVKAAKRVLDRVRQPTLIIHSRQDDHADLNNATYLQRNMTGPVDLVVLEDSYHMITLDKERHIVVDRTRTFIERVLAKTRGARNVELQDAA